MKEYFCQHPEIIVIDPLDNISILINRYKSYEILQEQLQLNGIKFPFLCKPLVAQGSNDAHKMMVIFNEQGVKDCQPPCVAQEFVNHNAILYKIYIVGENFHVVERPSFKNFYEKDCTALNTIFFSSHDICKSGSKSKWSILTEEDIPMTVKPKYEILKKIVKRVTELFGLLLVGVDVVIENHTGKYAIIDVNIDIQQHSKSYTLKKCLSDDLDSGFESDEKKKYSTKTNK
ncbi:inositol-tetrakisphosphate 1-kinase-like [Apis florea]|uniref:inositol-tetrakisphosphate 1-kinase-like n=1 Tax=Apis florea TaxID=7463 RepID=UPI0006294339|nr:inositol-tetrakisphosphate 1-kinase-like [Apis florea]